MKFIIILIALALERYTHVGHFIYRFNWFNSYVALWRKWLHATSFWQGIWAVIIIVAPLAIIVGLIYGLFYHFAFDLVGFILGLLVLIYCLGPEDIYARINQYLYAAQQTSNEQAFPYIENIVRDKPPTSAELNRSVTHAIIRDFNEAIFSTVFWFVILGPIGAVIYRAVVMTYRLAEKEGDGHISVEAAKLCKDVLEWVPIRLLGLGFALMGSFVEGFNFWVRNSLSDAEKNQSYLLESGLIALGVNNTPPSVASLDENKAALALTDRTLILYVVALALVTLGMLF